MSDRTAIEWTDATWNPITGCSVVSPGCTNCYAMKLAGTRLAHHPSRAGLTIDTKAGPVWNGQVRFNEQWLTQPIGWKRPRMVFVCAHGDLFHESVPDEWIDKIFAVMALAPQHTFQVLTKRAERMRKYLNDGQESDRIGEQMGAIAPDDRNALNWPIPNVWLGVSAEDQTRADERIPDLLETPAAVRWVSYEPALGPIDFRRWLSNCYECGGSCGCRLPSRPKVERCEKCGEECGPETVPAISEGCPKCGGELEPVCPECDHYMVYQHPDTPVIDWVICGGESGPGARPMSIQWAREARDQCAAAGVPFFFKQWGNWRPAWIHPSETPGRFAFGDYKRDRALMIQTDHYPRQFTMFGARSVMEHVGKKTAGRLLDGVEHNAMPGLR